MKQGRYAVYQYAATHQKHSYRARYRQAAHQPRHAPEQKAPQFLRGGAAFAVQPQAKVVELDDACYQPVNAYRHGDRDEREHHDAVQQRSLANGADGDDDDFCREDKVGTHRAFDFVFFALLAVCHCACLISLRLLRCGMLGVQQLVGDFFYAFKAQIRAAEHQQRVNQPRQQGADKQCQRHQYELVNHGAFGHSPDHGQLTLGMHACHLLRVERQIITKHASGFFGGYFAHYRNIVKQRGNIVQ